ncbi:antibiotic biosynthesis monooxygenase [Porticoccus sp. W117]|uniref:antibiotic biosynthesis monooxygenase family protein n=1 Tax=Porticoccus sp. W117 TaxID=3054777 RepID=UPI00259ACE71|nr:antibiotic biosynthesis monooxygenase [Porticoccus sp. W117]MDM3871603.1 antibiotic biosynthesis monooxygenase [Porticoccus sp. W117]
MTYAVIFTATPTAAGKGDQYSRTAERMRQLAEQQPGYIGMESACEGETEITISYWQSLDAIKNWKANSEHMEAQQLGRERWYERYKVEVVKVERCYEFASGHEPRAASKSSHSSS